MKYGVIGTGWITDSFIEATQEAGGYTLTAVYSRKEEKARQFAEKHGANHYFTDIETMAESPLIDCVYIASPNSLHFEQAITFLKNKKHVICEKPIFSNIKEWEQAYDMADKNNVYLLEAMRHIHSPNFFVIQSKLEDIGQIRSITLPFMQYSSRYDKYLAGERPNVFSAEFSGGTLVDLGVYPLAFAIAMFGKPNTATYFPVILESGVDGSGTLVLTYDKMTCTIMCSKITSSNQQCEIHGEKGTIIFDGVAEMNDGKLIKNTTKEEITLETAYHENNMVFEAKAFLGIIKNNDKQLYQRLREQSYNVLTITEQVRKDNHIIFASEK